MSRSQESVGTHEFLLTLMPRCWWLSALVAAPRTAAPSLPQSSCCYSWAFQGVVQPCSWCPSQGLALPQIASSGARCFGQSCPQVKDSAWGPGGELDFSALKPWLFLKNPAWVLRPTASENSYSGMLLAYGAHGQSLRTLGDPKGTETMSN